MTEYQIWWYGEPNAFAQAMGSNSCFHDLAAMAIPAPNIVKVNQIPQNNPRNEAQSAIKAGCQRHSDSGEYAGSQCDGQNDDGDEKTE